MGPDLKYFIKRLAYFSVFGFVVYNFLRLNEVKKTTNVDLLFLGSSHAYRGFDTRLFEKAGYKVFNLGSSSQTPTQTLVLLKRYLEQLNPKLVVFEVFPNVFNNDGVESTLDLVANDKNDLHSLKMVLGQKNMKVFNTYLYALQKELIGFKPNYKSKTYQEGGYVAQNKMTFNNDFRYNEKELVLLEGQVKNFELILNLLKKNKTNYLLVQAPLTSSFYKSYKNIDTFNSKMANYGDYYNFNNKLKLNDTLDFYDRHHLNQNGVTIFNKAFIKMLSNNYSDILKPETK